MIVGVVPLIAACAPIPPEAWQASTQLAGGPGRVVDMPPGRSTRDAAATDLPGHIDVERDTISIGCQSDDSLLPFHAAARISAGTLPVTGARENERHPEALRIHVTEMRLSPRLRIFHETDTLKRTGRIAGIAASATIPSATVDMGDAVIRRFPRYANGPLPVRSAFVQNHQPICVQPHRSVRYGELCGLI